MQCNAMQYVLPAPSGLGASKPRLGTSTTSKINTLLDVDSLDLLVTQLWSHQLCILSLVLEKYRESLPLGLAVCSSWLCVAYWF